MERDANAIMLGQVNRRIDEANERITRLEEDLRKQVQALNLSLQNMYQAYASINQALGELKAKLEVMQQSSGREQAYIWDLLKLIVGAIIGGVFAYLLRRPA